MLIPNASRFCESNQWNDTLHRGLATLQDGYNGVRGAERYLKRYTKAHLLTVSIQYNPRMTSYFGRAKGADHIDLNPRLSINTTEMVWQRKETFFHELAHTMMPGEGHNALWAWCFNCFGFMPLRHGQVDMPKMAAQAFVSEFLSEED